MKVKILSVSINPSAYDLNVFKDMNYDDAMEFFKNDKVHCYMLKVHVVDITKANEFKFACDGAYDGDGSDTMFVWVKVA